MTFVEKAQSFAILAAVFAGLALGYVPMVAQNAASFILPLLMLMLTGVFLHVPVRDFKNAFQFRGIAITSLVINFAWTPLFAWLLGRLFLSDQPALWVGFLMLMVSIFSINRGKVDLRRLATSGSHQQTARFTPKY